MALHTLEDWLLCMYGALAPDGSPKSRWAAFTPPISLATYDKRFITSVGESIQRNVGLTDRQVVLAVKVVTKYERQWKALGVNPSYLLEEDIPLQLPIRVVDRSCSIVLEDKTIKVTFPYNSELISEFYNSTENAAGSWVFKKEQSPKVWEIDFTEGNVHKIATMANLSKVPFEVDPVMTELFKMVREPILPTLSYVDGKMVMENVPHEARDSMVSMGWVEDSVDLLHWSLVAQRHGVDVAPSLTEAVNLGSRMLLTETEIDSYPGTSTVTWDEFYELADKMPNHTFLFYYRGRDLNKVQDTVRPDFLTRAKFLDASVRDTDTPNQKMMENITEMNIDLHKTILVTDLIIGAQRSREFLSAHCLGMLYMIPDNGRQNATMPFSH